MVIYCTGKDFVGRAVIYAYGCIHVPTQPGKHTRYIRMFRPVPSSLLTQALGWLTGKNAEYLDAPTLIAKGEGREVTRVQSGGLVKVSFQVTQRNMEKFGYSQKPCIGA
jgi:B9 domain-containing protein 1